MHNNKLTHCPLYNKGLYIEKISQTDARISMCCVQDQSPDIYNVIDFYKNNYLEKIRSSDQNTECSLCFNNEAAGNQSYRLGQIAAFALRDIKINNFTELVSLSYNCENTCNLKCITCGPRYSSMWRSEYTKLGYNVTPVENKPASHKNQIHNLLDLSQVRLLHFQGGEPLLTDDHKSILTRIKQQGNLDKVTVSYNTNGTIFPSEDVINLWRNTQMTKLFFSIDGIGNQFEYIRFPGKWNQVEKNMFKIRELNIAPMWVELGVTVSIANLFYLQDIIDWRDQHFSKLNNGDLIGMYINFSVAHSQGGEFLAIENLTTSIKNKAIDYLTNLSDKTIGNSIISWINKSNKENNQWIEYLDKLDKLRNTNWKTSLSKLYEIT